MQDEEEEENEPIKDEEVRKNIQVLSARLYDMKERFVKIVHKINTDLNGYADQTSDEDDTTDEESTDEMSIDEAASDRSKVSNSDDDEKQTQKFLIECVVESKSRRHEYLKHIVKYPKIMKYLLNDNPNDLQIPRRYLEPLIQNHIETNPTAKIYEKVSQQIQNIRQNYLKNCQ